VDHWNVRLVIFLIKPPAEFEKHFVLENFKGSCDVKSPYFQSITAALGL
jgi:hypothetical protein